MNRREELVAKVTEMVTRKFGGDFDKAFTAYDRDGDSHISIDELHGVLADSGVGNSWTWKAWARGVMEALDSDSDGLIYREEFKAVFNGG